MEIKKPKNFRGILSLQKYLDDNINNIRTRTFEEKYIHTDEPDILRFIHYVYTDKLAIAMDELIAITYQYNYTTDNILNSYWVKWKKNMRRIGKEWN